VDSVGSEGVGLAREGSRGTHRGQAILAVRSISVCALSVMGYSRKVLQCYPYAILSKASGVARSQLEHDCIKRASSASPRAEGLACGSSLSIEEIQ
jgi:hypothetical protein